MSSDFTVGVEYYPEGYRWRINQGGLPFLLGTPASVNANEAFTSGVAMLDQLRPKPKAMTVMPLQQYGSAPLSAVLPAGVTELSVVLPAGVTVMEPPQPTLRVVDSTVKSDWLKAMGTMPSKSKAPAVRGSYLVNKVARVANIRGWRCCYCGIELNAATATVEHIVAQSDGGGNDLANLELNCQPCNNERGRMPPDLYIEWRRRRGFPIWEGAHTAFWMPNWPTPPKKPPSIW